jgi:hypothetical protein
VIRDLFYVVLPLLLGGAAIALGIGADRLADLL